MFKNILDMIKILGLIALFILTFGLVNKLTTKRDENLEEIEEGIETNNIIINDIDEENKKIKESINEVKTEIKSSNETIQNIKEKKENTRVEDSTLDEAINRLRNIGKEL